MDAETKIRTLAQQSDELQAWFGNGGGIFRWFDTELLPNYLKVGSACVRMLRVSTIPLYSHETSRQRSQNRIEQIRFQVDVFDLEAVRAREAAKAVIDWFATVDFSSDNQFASPVTSPTRHPNFLLNHRAGRDPKSNPPAFVRILDFRILNLEE